MPHISAAMAASLRGGLLRRDILGQASDVKNTFSSWDGCMAKTYCKWPVIAGIIVGSLILLSIVACIVRCACCGMSCCCSCFSCLKCCGNCCGCCDDPKGRKHKHLDDEYASPFAPQTGYRPPAPMMAGGVAAPPQYAQFETGPTGHAIEPKVVNEDALPPMPSWEQAQKKRIAEETDAVEMGALDPATGQKVPLMTGAGAISRTASPGLSPVDGHQPYGDHPGMGPQNSSYMGAGGAAGGAGAFGAGAMAMDGRNNDPYANGRGRPMDNRGGYNANGRGGYTSSGPGRGQGYGDQGYGDQYDDQPPYNGPNNNFAPTAGGAYPPRGPPQRQYSGSSGGPSARPFPGDRQQSNSSPSQYGNRPYPPPGQGPYNNGPQNDGQRNPSSPINNNSGFDFHGGARPNQRPSPPPQQQQQSYGPPMQGARNNFAPSVAPSMPPSYRTNSPPQQQDGFSGYQPYSPPGRQNTGGNGGRGEPPNILMPGPRQHGGQPGGYEAY